MGGHALPEFQVVLLFPQPNLNDSWASSCSCKLEYLCLRCTWFSYQYHDVHGCCGAGGNRYCYQHVMISLLRGRPTTSTKHCEQLLVPVLLDISRRHAEAGNAVEQNTPSLTHKWRTRIYELGVVCTLCGF